MSAPQRSLGKPGSARRRRGLLPLLAAAVFSLSTVISPSAAEPPAKESAPGKEGFRPFEDTVYTLSYDAFLAAGKVREAYALAAAAVAQRPGLLAWRERMARTAEWTARPASALEQWEYLGAHGSDTGAFRESLRLAGLLHDHEACVRAWEGLSRLRKLDHSEWPQLLREYEDAGYPEKGIDKLRAYLKAGPDRSLMETLGDMQLRAGEDAAALETFAALARQFQDTPDLALTRAKILCRHGRLPEAAALLAKAEKNANPRDAEFWRYRASTALAIQAYPEALHSYVILFRNGQYEFGDALALVELARDRDSSLALEAAVDGWKRFAYPDFLVYYLERCIDAGRWDKAAAALSQMSPEREALFSGAPYFYNLIGQVRQHEGKADLARAEFLQALAFDPESESQRAGFLWLLIEQNRVEDLERYCQLWDPGVAASASLAFPLGVAYKLLRRNRQAVAYFRHLDDGKRDRDFPFLFNYAELLEQAGDGAAALATYRRAQAALDSARRHPVADPEREWLDAGTRWAIKFGNGDAARDGVERMLKTSGGGDGAKELALSWRMNLGENPEDAVGALQSRYGMKWAFPPWAELAVAMRRNDAPQVRELLDTQDAFLSPEDKAGAADFLGQRGRARALAGQSGGGSGETGPAMGSPGMSGNAQGNAQVISRNLYLEERLRAGAAFPLGDDVSGNAALESRRRPRVSDQVALRVPRRESGGDFKLARSVPAGATELSLGLKAADDPADTGLPGPRAVWRGGIRQEWSAPGLGSLSLEYARNAAAEEHPLLELAGMKDVFRAEAQIPLPMRSRLDARAGRLYFYNRGRKYLGSGDLIEADLSHRPLREFALGLEGGYRKYAPGPSLPEEGSLDPIAGIYPRGEFPQSYWQGNLHAEWGDERADASFSPATPFAAAELGMSRFAKIRGVRSAHWEPDFGLRGGLSLRPLRSQCLSLLAAYSQGIRNAAEKEMRLETRYEYFLK